MTERFSANVRDVHSVKTVHVCPRKQLQESVYHAVCVDTCFDAQRCLIHSLKVGQLNKISFYLSLFGMEASTCKDHAVLFRRGSEGFVIKQVSQHLHLKRNCTPLHSTPHSLQMCNLRLALSVLRSHWVRLVQSVIEFLSHQGTSGCTVDTHRCFLQINVVKAIPWEVSMGFIFHT